MIGELASIAAGAVVGGIGFRLRGGWLGDKIGWGSTTARIVSWAIPLGVVASAVTLGAPVWMGPAIAVAAWLAAIVPTFQAIDAGRVEGSRIRDFAANALRGLLMGLPMAAIIGLTGNPWSAGLLAVSMVIPLSYEGAWRFVPDKDQPTTYAEVISGACIGASVVAALLAGVA